MRDETISIEGDLEALVRQIESGFACQRVLHLLWAFAEWDGPPSVRDGAPHPTEEWLDDVPEEDAP